MSEDANRPLAGRRVLITQAEEKGSRFRGLLEELGAEVLQVPLIRFEEPDSWQPFEAAVSNLGRFQRILFTSSTAVDRFFQRLGRIQGGVKLPDTLEVTVVGPKTARAVERWDHPVREVAESYRAEGVLAILPASGVRGQNILFPRAQEARELLVDELTRRGARVTLVPVYKTLPVEESRELLEQALRNKVVDLATFTSASAVRSCADLLGEKDLASTLGEVLIACLGEVTAQAARSAGLHPAIVPASSTLEDFAGAIARHYRAVQRKSGRVRRGQG